MIRMTARTQKFFALGLTVFVGVLFAMPVIVSAQGFTPIVQCGTTQFPAECDFKALVAMGERIIGFLVFVIAVPIATILFVWAGFLYVSSGANPSNKDKAKKIFMNVLVGLLIALGAWLIINFITQNLLKGDPSAEDIFEPGAIKI